MSRLSSISMGEYSGEFIYSIFSVLVSENMVWVQVQTMSIISCIFKYFKNNMNKIKDLSTCWLYVALPLFPSARQPILSYKPFLTLRKASLLFSQPLTFIFRCFSAAASVLRSWLDLRPVKSALFSNLLGRAEV